MDHASKRRFFARYCRIRVPKGTFYHRQLRQRFREIGFRLISIERLETHPVWRIKLRGSLRTQADLLISQPAGLFGKSNPHQLLERQLTTYVQRILRQLGQPVRRDEIIVARSGTYVKVAFVSEMGSPGVLMPSSKETDAFPVSPVLRRWLRRQRN